MLKTLLKKQLLETLALFTINGKRKGNRSKFGIVALILLLLYAGVQMFVMNYLLAEQFCAPLAGNGLAWVYFSIMGMIAFLLACVVVIFMAKPLLFDAKDNEALLAMPIPPWTILFSRILSLYLFALLLVAFTLIPAIVQFFVETGFQLIPALCILVITLILPFGVLAVACLLGWIVAVTISKLKAKNILTFIFTAVFLVLYFYGYSKLMDGMEYALAHGAEIGEAIKTGIYPFWQMGLAATGNGVALLIFSLLILAVFALVYLLIFKTFSYVLTMKRGFAKPKYTEKTHKMRSNLLSLTVKEIKRFTVNIMTGLNCWIGSVLLLIFAILALVNAEFIEQIVVSGTSKEEIAVILSNILCFVVASNMLTASSVSLEGESLWVLRTMPIKTEEIFKSKIFTHLLLTVPFLLVSGTVVCILLRLQFWLSVWVLLSPVALSVLTALSGLIVNLHFPNLHWTNELVAVKQSLSPLVAMLIGWVLSGLAVGGWFLFGKYIGVWYLVILFAVFTIVSVCIWQWLKTRGKILFENL